MQLSQDIEETKHAENSEPECSEMGMLFKTYITEELVNKTMKPE